MNRFKSWVTTGCAQWGFSIYVFFHYQLRPRTSGKIKKNEKQTNAWPQSHLTLTENVTHDSTHLSRIYLFTLSLNSSTLILPEEGEVVA